MAASNIISVRITPDIRQRLVLLADAQGVSVSEVARALLLTGGTGGEHQISDQIEAVFEAVLERVQDIESRQFEPSAAPDLAPIAQRMERVERALNSLISAVERLYQTPIAAAQTPGVSAGDSATASGLPPGKKPAPPNGFWGWIEQQPYLGDDETKPQRSKRLIPVYNAQFHPEFKPGGA